MQLIPFHQIVNVLPAAVQKLTGFRRTDNTTPYETFEIIQRQRNAFTVFMEFAIRNHSPVAPHHAISIRLHLHGAESFLLNKVWDAFHMIGR